MNVSALSEARFNEGTTLDLCSSRSSRENQKHSANVHSVPSSRNGRPILLNGAGWTARKTFGHRRSVSFLTPFMELIEP